MSHAHYILTEHVHSYNNDFPYYNQPDCKLCGEPSPYTPLYLRPDPPPLKKGQKPKLHPHQLLGKPEHTYDLASTNPYTIGLIAKRSNNSRQEIREKFNTHTHVDSKLKRALHKSAAAKSKAEELPAPTPASISALAIAKQTAANKMVYTKVKGRKSKSRNMKGARVFLDYATNLTEARLLNREKEDNYERTQAEREYWEDFYSGENVDWDDYEERVHWSARDDGQQPAIGCYEECYQQDWNSSCGSDNGREATGLEVDDDELRALGILYDSEDEGTFRGALSRDHAIPSTPLVVPLGSPLGEPDLDDLWVVIQGRKFQSPAGSDWEVVSQL